MDNPLASWQERWWTWFVMHAQRPHALWWLGLISFADAIFFPIAPELFLVALVIAHRDKWRNYLGVAATCSALGAVAGYFIAAVLFTQFGEPILQFYGLEHAFVMARHVISAHVFVAMALASFTPIPDKVFIYAGGFLGAPFVPFIVGYVLGRTVRMALVVCLAHRFGKHALDILKRYFLYVGVALVVGAIIYGMVHWHLLGF